MTDEQINQRIAEACGWKPAPRGRWKLNERVERFRPDYLNDLNAMHEAEKLLTEDQISNYGSFLKGKDNETVSLYAPEHREIAKVAMATAAQRAEAFLKTLNL